MAKWIAVGAVFWLGVTAALPAPVFAEDMGDGADLTGGSSNDGSTPEVEAVSSPAPQPSGDADLTVGRFVAQQPIPHYATWLRLVQCEASGDWHNARNPIYKGGLQFDSSTWARHGGLEFAQRADYAAPEEQMIVGERTLRAQGWSAWPVCSRRLGLR